MDNEDVKKCAETLEKVFRHADEISMYIYSGGQDLTGEWEDYLWLADFRKELNTLKQCDWNIEQYFNHIATKDCAENPSIYKGQTAFVDGWETHVQQHLEELKNTL